MSTQASPVQTNHLLPPYPLSTHTTPIIQPSTTAYIDSSAFSHADLKEELNVTPSASTATTAPSTSTSSSSNPLPSSQQLEKGEIPPAAPSSKGKNGATGPAEGKSKPHLCHICGRGFTTGGHLQRHQRIHTGVKAFRCPFPGCETKTSRQDNLQQHYRTHLSPTLRRGDGSQARAAVNAAMEAAGIKSTSTRAPRKSKGSNSTPSSASAAGSTSLPSPYQTPTSQGPAPFVPYMYDPQHYQYPQPMPMMHQSANSSRVPSPVNHNPIPAPQHFYGQPFPPYGYPTGIPQGYRHFPMNPYAPPHYPPGMAPEHMFMPNFPAHSRDNSYSQMMTPGYPGHNPMVNGSYPLPPRTQTPMSQEKADLSLSAYARAQRPISPTIGGTDHSATSTTNGNGIDERATLRRTPPNDMISQGVVDPSNVRPMVHPTTLHYGYPQPQPGHLGYIYNPPQSTHLPGRTQTSALSQRASISSLSDGSGGGDGSPKGLE